MSQANRNELNTNDSSLNEFLSIIENDVSLENESKSNENMRDHLNSIQLDDEERFYSEVEGDYTTIKSSALVDSNNEESTDNEELDIERKAKFIIGDSDESKMSINSDQFKKLHCDSGDDRHLIMNKLETINDIGTDGSYHSITASLFNDGVNENITSSQAFVKFHEHTCHDNEANCGPHCERQRSVISSSSNEAQEVKANEVCQTNIKINIEDYNSLIQEYTRIEEEISDVNCDKLKPTCSHFSSTSFGGSALEIRQIDSLKERLAAVGISGSLSDNTNELSLKVPTASDRNYAHERKQMHERLKNWKKSNKIITHVRENPFNLHMDCLERLSKESGVVENLPTINQEPVEQNQRLQTYAAHLTHLYKRNQALMDNNADFRTLLYNIICCLLIQDSQVLSTLSVTKMLEVIRTHLESTSKFYSSAMLSVSNSAAENPTTSSDLSCSNLASIPPERRKSSLGSLSCTSSNSSGFNNIQVGANLQLGIINDQHKSMKLNEQEEIMNQSQSETRRPKQSDIFRRISSVSYNDEQLINNLFERDFNNQSKSTDSSSTGSGTSAGTSKYPPESPWKYEELSFECKHHDNNRPANQSSSENNSTILDFMNDSGIGTLYDYQGEEYNIRNSRSITARKRSSDLSEFKLRQKPSYMSTDDYLSRVQDNYSNEDESLPLQKKDFNERSQNPVDVASRRAELEWTLNKLINFELKYTWLTSRDTLRRAIRKIGVPNEIRGKVWLILIEQMIGSKYNASKLLEEASKTISEEETAQMSSLTGDDETQSILKQIELDVNRTMPGHKLFDDGAEGGIKLRRILVAYSIHINRAIAYCQGFNFIVALLLSVFEGDEENALRGFVCIVDHIFPSKFYFDHYLTGARADQFLLADFICDQLIKNPTTVERKMVEGVTSSITLNWFISLFHGAVPTLTRLTILDHFMLEGVKALFRFTMAILYLAFQVTPPSSCEVFTTIRNTAKDMYDIKLLLSIVEQIKLPKDSYFAIRRSFYMVQSSFNSDQFYMQTLSNDASKQLVSNKPLNVQLLPDTKLPAMSLITAASLVAHQSFGISGESQLGFNLNSNAYNGGGAFGPRVCTSSDRTKVCIQNIGKMGRSHIKIMDANSKSNERSLMSPLRNCLVIGISNCGKIIIFARQSSRRNYKTFREQDLIFHVHELCNEIFDGFFLENINMAVIVTHLGEISKIDTSKCYADSQTGSTETLLLRDSQTIGENEKVKLRLASMDTLTNLLWIYVECEDMTSSLLAPKSPNVINNRRDSSTNGQNSTTSTTTRNKFRSNNPFLNEADEALIQNLETQPRSNFQRKILIIDMITFDVFSAFSVHQNFGDIINLRTSLVAFCQLANPMSNQFSSRIVRVGPTGRYEHLLSFSDVVDFMINVPESNSKKLDTNANKKTSTSSQTYSTIRRLLTRSISHNIEENVEEEAECENDKLKSLSPVNLTKYYRSLVKSQSTVVNESEKSDPVRYKQMLQSQAKYSTPPTNKSNTIGMKPCKTIGPRSNCDHSSLPKMLTEHPSKAIITSYLGDVEDVMESSYIPVNMAFIFRNGKIALFEFTESYAIHTRESQLDRYDYSKIIEVTKSGEDFIITILTVYDKLIKVVI